MSNGFFFFFYNDQRHDSWNPCLVVLVLTTTLKCSLKAFFTSTILSNLLNVITLMHTCLWAGMMFLRCLSLEGSTLRTCFPQILEHLNLKILNHFNTSCVLHPCYNMIVGFNLFLLIILSWAKKTFSTTRKKCPKRPHY